MFLLRPFAQVVENAERVAQTGVTTAVASTSSVPDKDKNWVRARLFLKT